MLTTVIEKRGQPVMKAPGTATANLIKQEKVPEHG